MIFGPVTSSAVSQIVEPVAVKLTGFKPESGGGGASDPYWDNVTLLIQSNSQPDGSTTFVDYSSYSHTVAPYQGTPTHQTAQAIFGTSSIKIDWPFLGAAKRNLQITDSDSIFSGDFTVEWWQYSNYDTSGTVFFSNLAGTYYYQTVQFRINSSTVFDLNTVSMETGQWHHMAIIRNSSTIKLYKNGVQVKSATYTGTADFRNSYLGVYVSNGGLNWSGYIDQVRMTKDVARYTEDFTPPTEAFPTS